VKYEILQNAAFSILLGTFGTSLILAIRRGERLEVPFERLALAFLAIQFYRPLFAGLFSLGEELKVFISRLGDGQSFLQFVSASLYSAATDPSSSGGIAPTPNIPSLFTQVIRTGVWGIASSLVELVFLLAAFLLESGRDLLWQALLVFFPLSAAFLPLAPRAPISMALMGLELVLWLPILEIIHIAAGKIARDYSLRPESLGLRVLALEFITICLTAMVPVITHQKVSGGISGNLIDPVKAVLGAGKTFLTKKFTGASAIGLLANKYLPKSALKGKGGRNLGLLLLITSVLASGSADAAPVLILKKGFLKKVECKGRLYASGVGDDQVVEMEVLPSNLGCGVILKPIAAGSTNLILETSTGTLERNISVTASKVKKEVKK
jgi:hypothetical protein